MLENTGLGKVLLGIRPRHFQTPPAGNPISPTERFIARIGFSQMLTEVQSLIQKGEWEKARACLDVCEKLDRLPTRMSRIAESQLTPPTSSTVSNDNLENNLTQTSKLNKQSILSRHESFERSLPAKGIKRRILVDLDYKRIIVMDEPVESGIL